MTAPIFECSRCGRVIGHCATHFYMRDNTVLCAACVATKPDDEVVFHSTRGVLAAFLEPATRTVVSDIARGTRKGHRSATS